LVRGTFRRVIPGTSLPVIPPPIGIGEVISLPSLRSRACGSPAHGSPVAGDPRRGCLAASRSLVRTKRPWPAQKALVHRHGCVLSTAACPACAGSRADAGGRSRRVSWTGAVWRSSDSCVGVSLGLGPGGLRAIRPSTPLSLKRCTQSRKVGRSMPVCRSASAREVPSRTSARAGRRRA
jgi:hypothetical protein